jgi:hypothetical protein
MPSISGTLAPRKDQTGRNYADRHEAAQAVLRSLSGELPRHLQLALIGNRKQSLRCRSDRRRAQGHFTTGGIEERIESTLPPVLRPNTVPLS